MTNFVERLLARDLSKVLAYLVEDETVRGAIAIDSGMLIDESGDLPREAEALASQIHSILSDIRVEDVNLG